METARWVRLKDIIFRTSWISLKQSLPLSLLITSVLNYASSIRAASSGNLSHEEGLACEYCAYHFQRMNDHKASLQMFERAKAAFQRWGSQVKVDNMQAYILVAREKVAEKD